MCVCVCVRVRACVCMCVLVCVCVCSQTSYGYSLEFPKQATSNEYSQYKIYFDTKKQTYLLNAPLEQCVVFKPCKMLFTDNALLVPGLQLQCYILTALYVIKGRENGYTFKGGNYFKICLAPFENLGSIG